MRRRDGKPIWIGNAPATPIALERVDLRQGSAGASYDEAWLQRLLHEYPGVLPIEQIEPGFGQPIPLCCELPLTFGAGRSGFSR